MTAHLSDTILRLPEVLKATGLSRSSIYSRIKEGNFPSQVSLGGRAVGWLASEIEAWIQATRSCGLTEEARP